MKDNFEIKGDWFLPTDPDMQLKGLLRYDSTNGATLDVFGRFPKLSINIPIILGIDENGRSITLYRCFVKSGWSHFSASYVLIGHHFSTIEDLKFDEIISEIFNLDEWLAISGFQRPDMSDKEFDDNEIMLRYIKPPDEKFEISDSLSGSFIFVTELPGWSTTYVKDFRMAQRVRLQLNSEKTLSFEECLKHLFTFADFITLATYSPAYPNTIILKSKQLVHRFVDDAPRQKKITVHFPVKGRNDKVEQKSFVEMLHWYGAIRENFSRIITKWYKMRDQLESTHKLLFEQLYFQGAYNENNFLNLAQAIESFHARLHPQTKMPTQKYKAIRDEIIALSPSEHKSLLLDLFMFGNHLNLHTRINEVIEKYGNELIDKSIGDRETFIKKVKDSRNYYTHYSFKLEKKALKGEPLFWLGRKIQMIIVAAYMKEAGFDPEFVDKRMVAQKNYFISPFEK